MRSPHRLPPLLVLVSVLICGAALGAGPVKATGRDRNKVALIPFKCERGTLPELCDVLGESVGLTLGKAPGLSVSTPADLEVLMGAQTLADLSDCDGEACFVGSEMLRIDAAWLLAGRVTRVGEQARIVLRLVDLERGAVIDRDEVSSATDEEEMDAAVRLIASRMLARRGLLTLEPASGALAGALLDGEAPEPPGVALYVGVGAAAIGGAAVVAAGGLGLASLLSLNQTATAAAAG